MQDHKSLSAAVTIYATVDDHSFDFYIFIPVTLKSRSNLLSVLAFVSDAPRCNLVTVWSVACTDNII